MASVKWNSIGTLNKQLVLDLRDGKATSGGYPVTKSPPDGWLHGGFEYDVKGPTGLYNYQQKKHLEAGWGGSKYYCFNSDGSIDMAKRLVHIYKKGNGDTKTDHHFSRMIHTAGRPGCYNNDYRACEEITDIGTS